MRLAALALPLLLAACAPVEEGLNQLQRTFDNTPKTITLYSLTGEAVKTYDIGRSKVTRAGGGGTGDYIYFYGNGKYVQTNLPYLVESR